MLVCKKGGRICEIIRYMYIVYLHVYHVTSRTCTSKLCIYTCMYIVHMHMHVHVLYMHNVHACTHIHETLLICLLKLCKCTCTCTCTCRSLNLYTFPHYSDCQRRDWSYHRSKCRGGRPTPVGLPFVVSLPISQLTYSRLASVAEKFARSALLNVHVHVHVFQYSVLSIWCKTHKTSNMPSSTCTCP